MYSIFALKSESCCQNTNKMKIKSPICFNEEQLSAVKVKHRALIVSGDNNLPLGKHTFWTGHSNPDG